MVAINGPIDSTAYIPPKPRCVLHKHIRKHTWPLVLTTMKEDPSQICRHNSVGWSSLMLSIYHQAPIYIILAMFNLITRKDRDSLLSTPVPNGSRLCLHFASRYCSDLEVIKLIPESYPPALLVQSTDGVTPLERAIYYRKDESILNWFDSKTRAQKIIYELERYNQRLRDEVVKCCEVRWLMIDDRETVRSADTGGFIGQVYGYAKERAMIGLFWDVLSYVGVQSIPC